jgi:hypothetical protein
MIIQEKKCCVDQIGLEDIYTSRKVQAVVDTIFNKGEPAISVIQR